MINKYHHITGGGDTYYFQLSNLLRAKGHEVIEFCLRHPKNLSSEYSDYFVNGLTYENWKGASIGRKIKAYVNGVYNLEAKRKIRLLIKKAKPDIAHIHNIFYQISPSILTPLKNANIPVVQTLHDYQLICGSNYLYTNGKICKDCKKNKYYKILINRCFHNNLMASFLLFSTKIVHSLFGSYEKNVDIFISPSKFLKEKIESYFSPTLNFTIIPHAIDSKKYEPNCSSKDYVIFAGWLAKQKGIYTLIKAFETLPIKLLVFGYGPMEDKVKKYIQVKGIENIEIKGRVDRAKLQNWMKDAKFIIVPSEWYENSPMIIYESFALGKPVLASNIGGIPELVTKDVGRLFRAGDIDDLRRKVKELYYDANLVRDLGRNAGKKIQEQYALERHYSSIMEVYSCAMKRCHESRG